MFQISKDEFENLISQNVISSWGDIRKMLFSFTQDVIVMLSSVLKSKIAIQVNNTSANILSNLGIISFIL